MSCGTTADRTCSPSTGVESVHSCHEADRGSAGVAVDSAALTAIWASALDAVPLTGLNSSIRGVADTATWVAAGDRTFTATIPTVARAAAAAPRSQRR
jgi:hypothetical protein